VTLPDAGEVNVNFTIMETAAKKSQAGIVMRVGGKVVGRPSFFGLDDDSRIPNRLLRHVVGEVEADSLEGDVTADWGAIIENSIGYQEAREWIRDQVGNQVRQKLKTDVKTQITNRKKVIDRRLENLPEHRRDIAQNHLERVLNRFYGEAEERIDTVVSLMLDAMEKDEYWLVCQAIDDSRHADVATFATALEDFGLVDLVVMGAQAKRRLQLLDALDELAANAATLEKSMHKALDTNLWVFGTQYSVMASNKTLARTIEEYTGRKFKSKQARNRPDLLLAKNKSERYLLIEFKRPSATVDRDSEKQAKEYRDDLTPNFGPMDIIVIGGRVDPSMSAHYEQNDVKFKSYNSVISNARTELQWLLEELGK